MVQELVTWCTKCRKQGKRVPAMSTAPLPPITESSVVFDPDAKPKDFQHGKPRVLDYCLLHWKEILDPVAIAWQEDGLDADRLIDQSVLPPIAVKTGKQRNRRTKEELVQAVQADPESGEQCLVCKQLLPKEQISSHYSYKHPDVSRDRLRLEAGLIDHIYECRKSYPEQELRAHRGCPAAFQEVRFLRTHKTKSGHN